MYRYTLLSTLSVLMISLTAPDVFADGGAFKGGEDRSSWFQLNEKSQRAVISHKDGFQEMYLSVHLDLTDEVKKGLWLFPVKGTPETVTINLVDKSPVFNGNNPILAVDNKIDTLVTILRLSQVWPVLIEACIFPSLGGAGSRFNVSIHQSVYKWGMRTELIDATSTMSLANYLNKQGAGITSNQLRTFESYMNEDYMIVATWIDSFEEVKKKFSEQMNDKDVRQGRWPCVYSKFPTEKPFYPMKPTTMYEDEPIRLLLYVAGFYEVDNEENKAFTRPRYYVRKHDFDPAFASLSKNGKGKGDPYTWFHAYIDASSFPEDLTFNEVRNDKMLRYGWIDRNLFSGINRVASYLFVFLLWSYVCGGLAGLAIWGKWKKPAIKGLWNVTTVIGLYFILRNTGFGEMMSTEKVNSRKDLQNYIRVFTFSFALIPTAIQVLPFIQNIFE